MKVIFCGLVLLLATSTLAQQGQPPPQSPPYGTPPTFPQGQQKPEQQVSPDQEPPSEGLSNAETEQQIQQGIDSEPALHNAKVDVHVNETSVVITGSVETEEQHDLAFRIAQSYAGDCKIVDNIKLEQRT